MTRPARSIWDTRIQCVCGVIAAEESGEVELYLCANFGQVSLDPPRIIVNPNRVYPIEGMIRRTGKFSLNLMAESHRDAVLRLIGLRRREPGKAALAGLALAAGSDPSPWISDAITILFCEVEEALDTGDHTLFIARVTSRRETPHLEGPASLLYREIAGVSRPGGRLRRRARDFLVATGLPELARRASNRLRPPAPADLPRTTYADGGFTDQEIGRIQAYGLLDRGRRLPPELPRPVITRGVGVCVVGTHWGMAHCEAVRAASASAALYLCGRDPVRTPRMAGKAGAAGYFVGLDAALRDPRVHAVVLALPHHQHREASEAALAAGKDVLVEKPMATTLADADRMIAAAEAAGRILMIAENHHFRPSLRRVARRIAAGDLGEPLHFLARSASIRRPEGWVAESDKLGGGTFMDIGVHYVRTMRVLMGEPESVTAFRPMQVNTRMTAEDGLEAMYSSEYGWLAHLLTSWSTTLGDGPDVMVAGEKGCFHLWPSRGVIDFYPTASRTIVRLLEYVRPYALQAWLMRPGLQRERTRFRGSDAGYLEQMREFLSAVSERRAPASTARDGRRDLEIVLATYAAMSSGSRVAIPAPAG